MVCGEKTHSYENINTLYEGTRYGFCSDEHKETFERTPKRFT